MNSSGIKRGLAATAVSALAVAGLPFLANSASAAPGDSMTTAYVGPVRYDGDQGGLVVFKTKGLTAGDEANLAVIGSNLTSPANSANQTVTVLGATFVADDASNDFGGADGFDEIHVLVDVETPAAGDSFAYAAWIDDNTDTDVDSNEARAQVSGTTTGEPTSMSIAPAKQTVPEGVESDDYTLTLKDSAGRLTQLQTTEQVDMYDGGSTLSDYTLDSMEALTGTATFTASSGTADLYTITAESNGFTAADATAKLDVVEAADGITEDEVDIVSGKDAWDGFGSNGAFTFGNNVPIRVDQKSFTIVFDSPSNAGKTVLILADGDSDVTFDGKETKSYSTVLDQDGQGSITVTPDASSIHNGDEVDITSPSSYNGTIADMNWESPELDDILSEADTYLSAFGGSVDVTVTAVDQFGDPLEGVILAVDRDNGANDDAQPGAKKVTNGNGQATFTLTDTKATQASHNPDDVYVYTYDNVNDAPGDWNDWYWVGQVVYSADGTGDDFTLYNDALNTEAASYNPALNPLVPLSDAIVDGWQQYGWFTVNEENEIGIDGGTPGAPVTVSATNGALVLESGEDFLAEGAATETGQIGDTFRIIGTKTGLTTVTVTSGGRTHSTQMLVEADDPNYYSGRHLAIEAPEKAKAGESATFPVTVTDDFGNPVTEFDVDDLDIVVTGPADLQETDAETDENGVINVTVSLDADADSPVGVKVSSNDYQFGALANHLEENDGTSPTAPGLSASVDSVTGTVTNVVNIAALEAAVAAAQEKVDARTDALQDARFNVRIAKAERNNAQDAVDQARKDLRQAKKDGKGVKAARKALRQAKADLEIAQLKLDQAKEVRSRAKDRLEAAIAELEAAQAALEEAQN